MSIICFEYKACSIGYFMDEMKFYEIEPILKNLNYCVRTDFELTRNQMWASLQAFNSKKLKLNDIMVFPWEKRGKNKPKIQAPKLSAEESIRRMSSKEESTKAALMQIGAL